MNVKTKTVYSCQNCGQTSVKWLGKCPACESWNSLVEETVLKSPEKTGGFARLTTLATPQLLQDVTSAEIPRILLKDSELNRVLGGGLVPGALILFGGEPGIGKSTLLLQLALQNPDLKILYISGEESLQQIKLRAERLGGSNHQCWLMAESQLPQILAQIAQINPDLLIIDSIQTLYSPVLEASAGTVSQIRQCAAELMKVAKEQNLPIFLIGHITKDGHLAGPKILEHIVDVVLQFEGDPNFVYRLIRVHKNRFGPTHELGIYEMGSQGLKIVENPSQMLVHSQDAGLSGVAIASVMEGARPLKIEVQALVSSTQGIPQRAAQGFDQKRLQMLLAVLEKRCQFKLYQKDVFLNIAGGISVQDPAIDLAVLAAIVSSVLDKPISRKICFAAEVALTGEVRSVSRVEQRILEAERLGYTRIVLSSYHDIQKKTVTTLTKIQELLERLG